MRHFSLLLIGLALLGACSDTPVEEQSAETIAEVEKEIEAQAKSLEEAAAEAAQVLEAEIETELAEDGIVISDTPSTSPETPEE